MAASFGLSGDGDGLANIRELQKAVREELDLTLLCVVAKYFFVTPEKGLLEPGQSETFTISFQPTTLRRYEFWMQLLVDTAIKGTPGTEADTIALEVRSDRLRKSVPLASG